MMNMLYSVMLIQTYVCSGREQINNKFEYVTVMFAGSDNIICHKKNSEISVIKHTVRL